jgi:F-type H+-transporting ATPase subunit delta
MTRKTRRAARRLFRACSLDGVANEERVREVAARVAGSGRRGSLPTLWAFLRLVRLDLARRAAVVESAAPLPADVRDRVRADLHRAYGAALTTTFVVSPSLIGGMRIKVGSEVFDGSVRARLAALEERL